MNFVKASLKYKQVTLSVLLIVFAFGINSLLNMPRREDPKITIPGGLVIAYFPGANASQVEDQVTYKLEQYLFQYDEILKSKTYSVSSDGMVVVHVWLQENVKQPDIFCFSLTMRISCSPWLFVKGTEKSRANRSTQPRFSFNRSNRFFPSRCFCLSRFPVAREAVMRGMQIHP